MAADGLASFRILLAAIRARDEERGKIRFPHRPFWDEPVKFFRDVLGADPWSKQREIIEAVRDHPRVAVKSGHKVSKSHTAAGIGLCYYASHEDARVVMSSTTARQVDAILWRELKMMKARGGRCVACKTADPDGRRIPRPCPHSVLIDGDIGELARTGLKSVDFREIVGFTAREAEAVAGVSGRHLLYILDEASGIPEAIFEAIEGNRAGGARIVLFSNPTRTTGEFYEAFNSKKLDPADPESTGYYCVTVSSEETPNVVEGRDVIPGLATRGWVEEKRREWGEESPLFKVRVRGEFPVGEDGKIFSVHTITSAQERWHEVPAEGRLYIGVDPAGDSGMGDEAAMAARRGKKQLALRTWRGLSEEAHAVHLLGLIAEFKIPREKPVVVIDPEGGVGWKVYQFLAAIASRKDAPFDLVPLRASHRAIRDPMIYDLIREELAANLFAWIQDGGILEDDKLEQELHALEWIPMERSGKNKLTPKKVIRKVLGRSPDRYDATALSVWEPLSMQDDAPSEARDDDDDGPIPTLDPYAGGSTWR